MAKYLICGFSDIGIALSSIVEQDPSNEVTFISRQTQDTKNHCEIIDLTDPSCISKLEVLMKEYSFDIVINTIGALSINDTPPEKTLVSCDDSIMIESMRINLLPSLHIAQALSRANSRHHAFTFASFSARLSSISDNRLGGWYSYRIAKASLNALMKNISNEWKVKFPKAKIFGYHPGTVSTKMTKQWLGSTDPSTIFTKEQAAHYFLSYLNKHQITENGNLFDWKQQQIQF